MSLSEVCLVLAALEPMGVIVVDAPAGVSVVTEERLAALTVLARDGLERHP